MFKTVNLNQLDTILPVMANQLQVVPLHSVGSFGTNPFLDGTPSRSVTQPLGGAASPTESLSLKERNQLNSLFGDIDATLQKQNKALAHSTRSSQHQFSHIF